MWGGVFIKYFSFSHDSIGESTNEKSNKKKKKKGQKKSREQKTLWIFTGWISVITNNEYFLSKGVKETKQFDWLKKQLKENGGLMITFELCRVSMLEALESLWRKSHPHWGVYFGKFAREFTFPSPYWKTKGQIQNSTVSLYWIRWVIVIIDL